MTSGSLRERRKAETRAAILVAALDLFEQRGYESTTIEDIAAAAGIAPRTFFRYFDSKMAVVLLDADRSHDEEHHEELVEALVARPASESPTEAMASVIRDKLGGSFDDDDGCMVRQLRVVLAEPSLRALVHDSFHDHRPDLTRAFAARLGASTEDLGPRVLAAAFTEVIWVILERWMATGGQLDALPQMIDEAFASLSTGLGQTTN